MDIREHRQIVWTVTRQNTGRQPIPIIRHWVKYRLYNCHTTNAGWKPAQFPLHSNSIYALSGAHAIIVNNCNTCHNGNYNNTPNTCYGCHQADYTGTNDPPHQSTGFPTDCLDCHNTTAWKPATFDHDGKFFPVYSGKHKDKWTNCSDCHTNSNNYAVFSCITCHDHNQTLMNEAHQGVQGYVYTSDACLSCHPTGSSEGAFNHQTSGFPLTGAHTTINCADCHKSGYKGTPTNCVDCHQTKYAQTTNPNHQTLGLSTDCSTCHTTNAGWKPALFTIHGNYYQLTGAHATICNNCSTCHNGNYSNTPNTCMDVIRQIMTATTNPNHQTLGLSTDCISCHTTNPGWTPALFPVHSTFYALVGAHATIANNCSNCHNGNYNNTR